MQQLVVLDHQKNALNSSISANFSDTGSLATNDNSLLGLSVYSYGFDHENFYDHHSKKPSHHIEYRVAVDEVSIQKDCMNPVATMFLNSSMVTNNDEEEDDHEKEEKNSHHPSNNSVAMMMNDYCNNHCVMILSIEEQQQLYQQLEHGGSKHQHGGKWNHNDFQRLSLVHKNPSNSKNVMTLNPTTPFATSFPPTQSAASVVGTKRLAQQHQTSRCNTPPSPPQLHLQLHPQAQQTVPVNINKSNDMNDDTQYISSTSGGTTVITRPLPV